MAQTEVLLISPDFIRATTNISNNLQDKYLHSAIRESTDIDFEEIIGSKLLEKIKDLVRTGKIRERENKYYNDLLINAKYFLAYSTISRIVIISSAKIDNAGLSQTSDEHIESLQMKEIFQLEQYYRNKADVYKQRLQNYLKANYHKYPELSSEWFSIDPNLYSAASTNIFLGGARGKSYNPVISLADKYKNKYIC